MNRSARAPSAAAAALLLVACGADSDAAPSSPPAAASTPEPAAAKHTPPAMAPYTETIAGTGVSFDMVPVPAGEFDMGSPEGEAGRRDDEGPVHRVRVDAFWIGKCEVTWDEYTLWAEGRDLLLSRDQGLRKRVDGITRPTPAYTDMSFGMGREGYPAICMTQHAARTYCEWLSAATGRTYRLPTEAEWEYACRAGTTTAYSFGDDPADLRRYAWFAGNSRDGYRKVGLKEPNPWGLHDMHGNVAEWVLDQYLPDFYAASPTSNPLAQPQSTYPRVVRGGSWQDPPDRLRSAARRGSDPSWKEQDPQLPKSIWYHTDALFVGFRVVRP